MKPTRTTLEVIADTIEAAIEKGLADLHLSREAVEVEVLDEGNKGLFGLGSRQARVRLIVLEREEPRAIAQVETAIPQAQKAAPQQNEKPFAEPEASSPPVGMQDPLDDRENVLDIARSIVVELLDKMQVRADVSARYDDGDGSSQPAVRVDVQGDDLSILIGRQAETLNALQYITNLIIGKELGRSVPLIIDVEGFRSRREQQLKQLAFRVSEQVIRTGRSQALEPMSPAERRLVHIALRDHNEVYTESVGDGERRKVVIFPKS
ncbi:MAG: protein jag [Anaerolineales bacterium]|nr:protein jag [Anaerolineales bacterium]